MSIGQCFLGKVNTEDKFFLIKFSIIKTTAEWLRSPTLVHFYLITLLLQPRGQFGVKDSTHMYVNSTTLHKCTLLIYIYLRTSAYNPRKHTGDIHIYLPLLHKISKSFVITSFSMNFRSCIFFYTLDKLNSFCII